MKNINNEFDWIIHFVLPDEYDPPYLSDIHTHGLDKYNHPELMIVLSLPENVCGMILNGVGMRIRNGERFDKEEIRTDILANSMPVKLVSENIGGKELMVLIFPDAKGLFPEDSGCDEPYNKQLEYLDYIKNNRY